MNPIVQQNLTDFAYLASIVLFILSLRWLSSPSSARRGVRAGEIGMAIAILATLAGSGIIQYKWILIGLVIG
ncbi:MAG TPA: NAD(P)(+) transhydrogenase (Re/Si-specific) subunit beta, partial [Candidatus Dormibacteraeota bacterium]|nr:NAD(P)(+) transhydrogenase (Re/Si-specific) subunit beta [Candidatus Dormibacteraeota bacterium]